jgi:hypothetical protein
MDTITDLWMSNKNYTEEKGLNQILTFTGDGTLKDNNQTSIQFREFLENIPTYLIKKYAEECLSSSFTDSGFALQDIINQIGSRLGFNVEYGRYRGKRNQIGFDGIWTANYGYSLIVEVKTTDYYRINLDTIANYRTALIQENRITKENSSILIVVGRQDTGDLEAQIRGSRHAWDIRLISIDSLLRLLDLKEELNDAKTIQQINTILKPLDYTKLDKLLELIFITSDDLQLGDETAKDLDKEEIEEDLPVDKEKKLKLRPVSFHEECIRKVEKYLRINLLKHTRTTYKNKANKIGVTCSISKPHNHSKGFLFWFAFHPFQQDFMEEFDVGYNIFGCGSSENTFLIPYSDFKPWIENFWTTDEKKRMYWHVVIVQEGSNFYLKQPKIKRGEMLEITPYKI